MLGVAGVLKFSEDYKCRLGALKACKTSYCRLMFLFSPVIEWLMVKA